MRQWFAAVFEFGTTWLLLQKDGKVRLVFVPPGRSVDVRADAVILIKVTKEDLRRTYDVSGIMS